ncbi:MAG: DNA polymerase IV [Candidatus Bipolaricaulota bacterium]|nr:DNA polymerase IV [Candidatus Bipolaricaulota bacterium]
MERAILHLDMDAFYASVEQLDRPELRGRPVVVGGLGPRGVVATASYEARAYGVRSAMPTAKARALCPHAVFLPPRFARYEELAHRVRGILARYSPLVEPLSLDEAFVDLTGTERLHGPPEEAAREIHRRIREEVGLSCSVGVGPNKLLAKLASEAAKPGGIRVIRPEDVAGFLGPLPVDRLWGVGPQTAARLAQHGIRTVGDLREVDAGVLQSWFGPAHGAHLWRVARGLDDSPVEAHREVRSISHEETFPQDLLRVEDIEREVRRLADRVSARLGEEGLLATTVSVKIRWADFRTRTRQVRLPEPTDHPFLLVEAALGLLRRGELHPEAGIRLLGVGVSGLVRATFRPVPLFVSPAVPAALRAVRARHGPTALTLGFPEEGPRGYTGPSHGKGPER